MAKRESLNKEALKFEKDFEPAAPSGLALKLSGFSRKVFNIVKFILGILLLPLVYASTIAFTDELSLIEQYLQGYFWTGVVSLVIIYLFIWEPAKVYNQGQKILEFIFSFFKPLVRVAPYLLPVYTIVFFLLYLLLALFIKSAWLISYTVFIFGFTLALHLVFGAKSLRSRKEDFLKGNYIFGFSFVYIINLFLAAVFLNSMFDQFSLVNFTNNSFNTAGSVIAAIFKQLFFIK